MLFRLIPLTLLAALMTAGVAQAAPNYPAPAKPKGSTGKPKGPFRTLKVSKTNCQVQDDPERCERCSPW